MRQEASTLDLSASVEMWAVFLYFKLTALHFLVNTYFANIDYKSFVVVVFFFLNPGWPQAGW